MKLELKHLAPYLPYGLKNQRAFHKPKVIDGIVGNKVYFGDTVLFINQIEPILRPLSDLTKEINMDGDMVSAYEILPRREKEDYKNPIIGYWSWDAMQILLEHHFDVFGLIDAGLAIDINTL